MSVIKPPWTITNPSSLVDSFGRGRVSEPKIFFNSDFEYDANPLWFISSITGTGSFAKTVGESSVTLSTGGTASGAGVAYQTKQYFRYEPGKGRLCLLSGLLGAQTTNVRSRFGNFDANNGSFFEMDGTLGPSIVLRSNVGGSVVDTKVPQSQWNIDQMNGAGPSGVNINFANMTIFWLEENCSGVGCVRYGFIVNGVVQACHEIYSDNKTTVLGTNTLSLPLRQEIYNTGSASGINTSKIVIMALSNEGGGDIIPSYIHYVATSGPNSVAIGPTYVPIVSIQPKLLFAGQTNRIHILLDKAGLIVPGISGGSIVSFKLMYDGALTGASFSSVDPTSVVNFDVSATALSGGTEIHADYAAPANNAQIEEDLRESVVLPFTLDINGANPDTYTLVAAALPVSTVATCAATETDGSWTATALELVGTSYVNGAINHTSGSATNLSVAYAPTAGNMAVVYWQSGTTGTNPVVRDTLNNILTVGPGGGSQALQCFYQNPVPAGVTGYVATWTGSHDVTLAVEEYSAVTAIGGSGVATGGSSPATIALNMANSGNMIAVGLGISGTGSFTGTNGNLRHSASGGSDVNGLATMDNTSVPGSANVSGKISWIELR